MKEENKTAEEIIKNYLDECDQPSFDGLVLLLKQFALQESRKAFEAGIEMLNEFKNGTQEEYPIFEDYLASLNSNP